MQFDTTIKELLKAQPPRLLAMLAGAQISEMLTIEVSHRIIEKIATLPSKAARNELAKLLILSKLRGLQKIVVEEAKKVMELSVEDLIDIPFVEEAFLKGEKEGKKEGKEEMLSRMLEGRFGPLPEWAKEKIASAEIETLEKWGLRLLDASKLEEVLVETIN